DPSDPDGRLGAGGLSAAVRVSASLGRAAGPLRGVMVRRLLPAVRGPAADTAPPAVKAQLVECYLQPFAEADAPLGELAGYWAAVARLHEHAVAEAVAADDLDTLLALG